jgi:hypothetical protein
MNATKHRIQPPAPKGRGRPRTSALTRQEQLRMAKQTQREREKANGTATIELRLEKIVAQKLKTALVSPTFYQALNTLLANEVVDINETPMLRDIAWNRESQFVPAIEAMALYERNWRFVDTDKLLPSEAALIENLTARFGNGVLNV